jgi:RNA polymerase sigma factor for flagellar operon FliA
MSSLELHEHDHASTDDTEQLVTRLALAAAIATLRSRDAFIVRLRFEEDLTLHEIAGLLEVSESRVCEILARVMRQLRRCLA